MSFKRRRFRGSRSASTGSSRARTRRRRSSSTARYRAPPRRSAPDGQSTWRIPVGCDPIRRGRGRDRPGRGRRLRPFLQIHPLSDRLFSQRPVEAATQGGLVSNALLGHFQRSLPEVKDHKGAVPHGASRGRMASTCYASGWDECLVVVLGRHGRGPQRHRLARRAAAGSSPSTSRAPTIRSACSTRWSRSAWASTWIATNTRSSASPPYGDPARCSIVLRRERKGPRGWVAPHPDPGLDTTQETQVLRADAPVPAENLIASRDPSARSRTSIATWRRPSRNASIARPITSAPGSRSRPIASGWRWRGASR